jgi:hypothetical protein
MASRAACTSKEWSNGSTLGRQPANHPQPVCPLKRPLSSFHTLSLSGDTPPRRASGRHTGGKSARGDTVSAPVCVRRERERESGRLLVGKPRRATERTGSAPTAKTIRGDHGVVMCSPSCVCEVRGVSLTLYRGHHIGPGSGQGPVQWLIWPTATPRSTKKQTLCDTRHYVARQAKGVRALQLVHV